MSKISENTLVDTNIGCNVVVLGKTGAGKTFLMSDIVLPMMKVKGNAGKPSCRANNKELNNGK